MLQPSSLPEAFQWLSQMKVWGHCKSGWELARHLRACNMLGMASFLCEEARTAAYLDRLIASVVEGDADVNGAIVVDLVENEVGGLRPQASIVWHCDGCLQAS